MAQNYKPFLALALVFVVLAVVFLSPGPTGDITFRFFGSLFGGDTTTQIAPPPKVNTTTTTTTTGTGGGIGTSGGIGTTGSQCTAAGGTCTKIDYCADRNGISKGQLDCTGYSVCCVLGGGGGGGTPVTITKSAWDINYLTPRNDIPLEFGQDYLGGSRIDFKGIPGGELCGAAVKLEAYDAADSIVTSGTTGRVDTHQTASGSATIPTNRKIAKVKGYLIDDGSAWTNDCQHIDFLEAKLVISDDKNGPTISFKSNSVSEQIASSGGYSASQLVKVTLDATATDPSKVSSIIIKIGNTEKKNCGFSTPLGTAACTYDILKNEIISYSNSGTQTVTIESTDALGNKNVYTDSIKINRFGYCFGSGC